MADYTAPDRNQLQTSEDRNKVNTAMRATPEWRNAITALGHNPDGPLKLNKSEQQKLTQQLGLPADDFHIDPAGNINDFHGWKGLPTWAKTAVIVGAAVGTAGAAGAFGGGAGALSAGGVGAGEAGATGVGGLTATSLGLPVTAGLGTAGTAAGVGGTTAALAGGSKLATGLTTAEKIGGMMRGGGQAVGNATQAAGNNRMTGDELAMRGQQAYEGELGNRSDREAQQRQLALKDLYRASYAANRKPGPYNTAGLTTLSPSYTEGLSAIEQQGLARLKAPAEYGTNVMPALKPFAPTPPSGMEKVGNWLAPAMTIGGMAADYYGSR